MTPRGVSERAPHLAFSADDQLRLTYVNAALRAVLGYEPGQVLGTRVIDYVHPDDVARAESLWQELAGGQEAAGAELRVRHAQGHYIHMVLDALPRLAPGGQFAGVDGIGAEAQAPDQRALETVLAEAEHYLPAVR